MTSRGIKNVAASVRARLLARAKAQDEDFQLVLVRFAGERLLYRLSRSEHASRFVLKGATLFILWRGNPHRATRDLDLLGFGSSEPDALVAVMLDVLATEVEDDGLDFDADSLVVGPIRDDQEYGGVRATLTARLGTAKVRVQVDVGFGDAITPGAEPADLPTLLDLPAPRLRVYPRETVVAEKVEAMCQLGLANSRMKDFYDLVVLSKMFEFDGGLLLQAVRATFERRRTPLPESDPVALTPAFYDDAAKQQQWRAFQKRANCENHGDLPAIMAALRIFALPLLAADTSEVARSTWRRESWVSLAGG